MTHDTGFAPCFDEDTCTLACCKPRIRRTAKAGDWILGLASRRRGEALLLYAMQVGQILSFLDYAREPQFKGRMDNIYQPDGSGGLRRVAKHQHHLKLEDQQRDWRGSNVLVASWHWRNQEGLALRLALDSEMANRLWNPVRDYTVDRLDGEDLKKLVAKLMRMPRPDRRAGPVSRDRQRTTRRTCGRP